MKNSTKYKSWCALMAASVPIAVLAGLDSWVHVLFRGGEVDWQLAVFPVFFSIGAFSCLKATLITL
ncbi:hypothetical protein [Alkalicoccus luteus]|uniref:Uncharacterized protein n=1 Tax=Alkalicoccus luteus TaxID=1237094 RepID=A0A969PU37_9BACI|nr:hypothetical protein [Alkalicoccus luteus]NJP37564.1 hypothetical protein [Alkalicoccus luteus]